jgi:Tfp pilus assembly protein PilV
MRTKGFTFLEVLLSLFLLLATLLLIGRANMTSLNLVARGKIGQRASLLLLEKIEELRTKPIQDLAPGDYEEATGAFDIQWRIANHTPYFGTKQIQCRVVYSPAVSVLAESVFYRSE